MDTGDQSYGSFALHYAYRNLGRNRRRTTLTIATVAFAVAVAIVASRYSQAIMKLWEDGAVDTGSAHAQIHAAGYLQRQEGVQLDLTVGEGNDAETAVRADPTVEASVRRLELEGIVSTGEESLYFMGKGVEGAGERAVSPRLFTDNDAGRFINDDDPTGIVVGQGLAESLKLKLGDDVTLITQTVQGSVNGVDAHIVGIVDAAIPSFSKRSLYAPIALLQKLVRMPGRYTSLAVRLKPDQDPTAWVERYKPVVLRSQQEIRGWWAIEPMIKKVGLIWDSVVTVIAALLFLSTAISVLNIIFMMVAERTVEIGTLMAIGARPRDVKVLFALEAALIGLCGGLVGALIGNGAVFMMGLWGLPFKSPFGSGVLVVHPSMSAGVTGLVFVVAVVICYLSALLPARKAAAVEPVRAFRGLLH